MFIQRSDMYKPAASWCQLNALNSGALFLSAEIWMLNDRSAVSPPVMFLIYLLARYNERVVWNDKQLNLKLLRKGVLTRIYTPMVRNNAHVKSSSVSCYLMLNCSRFLVRQLFKACGNLVSSLQSLHLANLLWMRNSYGWKPMPRAKMLLNLETCRLSKSDLLILRHLPGKYCKLLSLPSGIGM